MRLATWALSASALVAVVVLAANVLGADVIDKHARNLGIAGAASSDSGASLDASATSRRAADEVVAPAAAKDARDAALRREAQVPGQGSSPASSLDSSPLAYQDGSAVKVSGVESLRRRLEGEFTGYSSDPDLPAGQVRQFDLVAGETEIELIDGQTTRVWAYNDQVPGPELRVELGDTVRVHFRNDMAIDTTIHWHGVRVPNAMDGVPGVTQDPIAPGESFDYEFTPADAGTFWFHPHVRTSEEIERGLYGVLIVEDPEDSAYTQDVVWVIDDWLLLEDGQIYPEFNTMRDLMHDGRWGNVVTVNSDAGLSLEAKAGERIRLRLINPSNARVYMPDFSGLEAQVIAYDGIPVETPFPPQGLELAPGNRMDLDITFPPDMAGTTFDVMDRFTRQPFRLAQIVVADEVVETPDVEPVVNDRFPRWEGAEAVPVDHVMALNATRDGMMSIKWTINGKAYPDSTPLHLDHGRFAKIRVVNESGRLHPMHLHGQFFRVLSRDGEQVSEPFWRDTVLVYPREVVEVGLVPVDIGKWATHCHILEHAEAGMMTLTEVQ
jgi:FtsP/CotA-like multicopper oxidase with cupredoxin domain